MDQPVCLEVHKAVADLVHHGQEAVFSTLFEGLPVDVCKHFVRHPGAFVEQSLKTK